MRIRLITGLAVAVGTTLLTRTAFRSIGGANAPQPASTGRSSAASRRTESPKGPTPTSWDFAKGTKRALEDTHSGLGLSSPVFWGDRIYLTSAISGSLIRR